jgi:phage terminase Nu1 subunit (DNA packaging protein)
VDATDTALLDVAALAGLFRVTEKTVRDWTAQGMPVAKAGGKGRGKKAMYRLGECVEWYFEENFERLELDRQRTRLAAEQAQKIAIENALRTAAVGELDIWQAELE